MELSLQQKMKMSLDDIIQYKQHRGDVYKINRNFKELNFQTDITNITDENDFYILYDFVILNYWSFEGDAYNGYYLEGYLPNKQFCKTDYVDSIFFTRDSLLGPCLKIKIVSNNNWDCYQYLLPLRYCKYKTEWIDLRNSKNIVFHPSKDFYDLPNQEDDIESLPNWSINFDIIKYNSNIVNYFNKHWSNKKTHMIVSFIMKRQYVGYDNIKQRNIYEHYFLVKTSTNELFKLNINESFNLFANQLCC